MTRFLQRNQYLHLIRLICTEPIIHLQATNHHFQNPYFIRFISSDSTNIFSTVDYLVNSCGLSPEAASSTAKKIHLRSKEKPDSVLTFFQNHGFTKTQITKLISKYPQVLGSNPDKTLKPKIDFLHHRLGISGLDLCRIITSVPLILRTCLRYELLPSFDFLKTILHTDEHVKAAFKRHSRWILRPDLEKIMAPNIEILRNHGVSEPTISKLLASQPITFMRKTDRFNEVVEMVKQMGFDPLSPMFPYGIQVIVGYSKLTLEKKFGVFREFGFSEEEIQSMFKRQPTCLNPSEKNMRIKLEFFIKKLKLKPVEVSSSPAILCLSMEKRIKPRCEVLEILKLGGVVRKRKLTSALILGEEKFFQDFVVNYVDELPQLMKAYKGVKEDSQGCRN